MRVEIPKCLRCCGCIPLRPGILVIGYLNLLFTLFIISIEAWLDFGHPATQNALTIYRGVSIFTHIWLLFVLNVLELIFNLVLIVGAHTKRVILIKAYYYYGIVTVVASLLMFLMVKFESQYRDWYVEFCLAFSAFIIQVYLLFLIRSELQKARYKEGQLRYVNHMAEVVVDQPTEDGRNPL